LGSDGRAFAFETGKVYLDPKHHVPLKLYDVGAEEVERLRADDWRPSLYLTPREREIVETQGTVCVLGRSGTGKTSVISNRIQYDRHKYGHDQSFSQLFVARSRKVCNYVKATVGDDAELSSLHYWTYEKFLSEAEKALGIEGMTDDRRSRRVDFNRFKLEFVDAETKIDPLIAWTQIRSFIKGSIQSVTNKRPLTREEYLSLRKKQNRLDQNQRKLSYSVFEAYSNFIKDNKLWDDTDRVSKIVVKLLHNAEARHALKHNRLYVDEVQDFTQAEVAMFFHCCETGKLFMAGDPAQAVEEGVDFRFEDIRMVAHNLFGDNRNIPDKPKLLKVNFRSHAGVLNLAAGVLDIMFKQFPGSARELAKDEGLFRGPRPALFSNLDVQGLKKLIRKQEGAVILGMTEVTVDELQKAYGDIATVLSIRDSKGLEFDHGKFYFIVRVHLLYEAS
jgi:ABC-type dipeptide/oligopeptide/nickel transport system ATPase subunit